MRITRQQLHELINEEISSVLRTLENRQLIEAVAEVEEALMDEVTLADIADQPATTDTVGVGSSMKEPNVRKKSQSGVINLSLTAAQLSDWQDAIRSGNIKKADEIMNAAKRQ